MTTTKNPYPDLYTQAEWEEIDKLEQVRPGMGVEMQVRNLCRELGPLEAMRRLRRLPAESDEGATAGGWEEGGWKDASPEQLARLAEGLKNSRGIQE